MPSKKNYVMLDVKNIIVRLNMDGNVFKTNTLYNLFWVKKSKNHVSFG
jgi:hypothetical protein